jgi:hypothetical protein
MQSFIVLNDFHTGLTYRFNVASIICYHGHNEGAMVALANGERHFVAETELIIDDMIDTAERLHPLANDRKETQRAVNSYA